jgi:hypothetical protein
MSTLKVVSVAFSVVGCFLGLFSTYLWLVASKVSVSPAWELDIRGDINKNIMGWATGVMIAFKTSGKLNSHAARWTAATVAVTTIASVLSTLA